MDVVGFLLVILEGDDFFFKEDRLEVECVEGYEGKEKEELVVGNC